MKRNAIKKLEKWKNEHNTKPMWIIGAKGVGKTYLAYDFAKAFFDGHIYVNFEHDLQMCNLVTKATHSILDERSLIDIILEKYQIDNNISHNLLFIFDEITACDEALVLLDNLVNSEINFHIILISSRKQKVLIDKNHYEYLELFPLSFDEYLAAVGSEWYIDIINAHFSNHRKIPDIVHDELLSSIEDYLIVGGMPASINDYLLNENFDNIHEIHSMLTAYQKEELVKYCSDSNALKIRQILATLPSQLNKENHKFMMSLIRKGITVKNYSEAFNIITNNNYAYSCNKFSNQHGIDNENFKIYFQDVGLLYTEFLHKYELDDEIASSNFRKILLENFAVTEFLANGINPMFWESGKKAKLDLVVEIDNHIIPIEIMDKDNSRSKSLGVYKQNNEVYYSYRISDKNFSINGNMIQIPYYAMYCIKNEKNK